MPRLKVRHPDIVEARAQAHQVFDRLWREGFMTKDEAYQWLASRMHLPAKEAHIGRMHFEQLEKVKRLVEEKLVSFTKLKIEP